MKTPTLEDVPRIREALAPAVAAYFAARAHAAVWRERMTAWEREELARFEYATDSRFVDRGRPARVLDPALIHTMEESQKADFYRWRDDYVASLKISGLAPGHCPACVAECLVLDCENLILKIAAQFFPELASRTLYGERHRKAIDLHVQLVIGGGGARLQRQHREARLARCLNAPTRCPTTSRSRSSKMT